MGLHGSQMRGCQLLMGDCLSVAPQDMPVERRSDLIPPLMQSLYTYAYISIAELPMFWSLCQVV